MKSTMIIPAKITVGFQKRTDTYSDRLGFITYTDHKGLFRCEKSWEGWRDKTIPAENFDNAPTSGFVLNKDVGGVRRSYGWDARIEKVRVHDPRGWEFEITVPNLLYVLQECTSIKGKGLEGEMVYAWDGKSLVLLPTSGEEYKECKGFSKLQGQKVEAKTFVPGRTFLTKDQKHVVYMGRFNWYGGRDLICVGDKAPSVKK